MLNSYTIEIASAIPPPIKLEMCDSLNCPICDIDLFEEIGIDLRYLEVNDNTTIYCKECDLNLKFKIVRI